MASTIQKKIKKAYGEYVERTHLQQLAFPQGVSTARMENGQYVTTAVGQYVYDLVPFTDADEFEVWYAENRERVISARLSLKAQAMLNGFTGCDVFEEELSLEELAWLESL